jgi:hypothetical protein
MFDLNFLLFDRNPDVEFTTSLSVDECKKRLMQEKQRKRKLFGFQPPPPIIEYVHGDRFLVSRNQSLLYRDNFLVLSGKLKAKDNGTLVRAVFRLYGGTSFILISGFGIFFGMAANEVILKGADPGLLLLPVVFWGFIGLVGWLINWLNKTRRNDLAIYLQNILMPITNSTDPHQRDI